MVLPKKIGIAISKRETAKLVFRQCKKIFQKKKAKLIITANLEFEKLKKNTEFLQSDLIICFGGDGSFLRVCQAIRTRIPVFLVGTGERNYLSSIDANEAPKKIEQILDGQYKTEKRDRLETNIKNIPQALNEIVIATKQSASVLHYELYIENQKKWHDYSDGIIVCTPTGSSAYFAAAGGPEIETKAQVIGIASLNSIEKRNKIICNNKHKIKIKKISALSPVEIIIDGQQRTSIADNAEIHLSKNPVYIGFPAEKTIKAKQVIPGKTTPSARIILMLLQSHGASTQQEIIALSGLHSRSIRRALEKLLLQKKIAKRPYSKDKRQDLYHPV